MKKNIDFLLFEMFCRYVSEAWQNEGDRESATSSAHREKEALHPPPYAPSRRRGRATRFGGADDAVGTLTQAGVSQIVDQTQYQHHQDRLYMMRFGCIQGGT